MVKRASGVVRIGILGDFDRGRHSHWATEAALFHAAAELDLTVQPDWIPAAQLAGPEASRRLEAVDGVWGAPGIPVASMNAVLRGIEFAREHDIPYLGTCAGFQYALVEFTRNVLGIANADSAENTPGGENVVITPVECELPDRAPGQPRLSGTLAVEPVPTTLFERLCGKTALPAEFFCSYETNAAFAARWQAAGLRVGARGPAGEMRAFELPEHRFFMATLFQPQLSSSLARPHPIVIGYLRACTE